MRPGGLGLLLLGLSARAEPSVPLAAPLAVPLAVSLDPVARFDGEQVTWEVRYAGVAAGTAWAGSTAGPDGSLLIEGGARNAPWYGGLYSIDDWVRSTWQPGLGSLRYETRFREGGFHQDQDMRLGAETIEIWRKQRIDGEWREWTRSLGPSPGAEDPISAVQRLRTLDPAEQLPTEVGPGWSFPIFSGDRTWPLVVTSRPDGTLDSEVLGEVPVRVLELHTRHEGQLEQRGRFRIWLTDDARAIPVRMVVKSNFGAIRAELVDYRPPTATAPVSGPAGQDGAAEAE